MKRVWLAMFLVSLPAAAGGLRRAAVIVGANHGVLGRASLRYSYSDADEMAAVLVQAGEFDPADVHVLKDPQPQTVLGELDRELQQLQKAGGESLLLFYYSGHADASSLYPDGKPLPFSELRERLDNPAATVRVGIIDACSGGGWTGTKGLQPAAPFVVDVPLELPGEGSVLIASSSGLEKAHESDRILGSFFTHHLVAALRGAADTRGDGVVTVGEAFAYAKERTVRDSAAVSDPQHPSFSMNLRGRSDLPLTRVAAARTTVELNESEGPLQLIHLGSGLVVLEVPPGSRVVKLSVPPGRYLVRRQRRDGNYTRAISVEEGKSVELAEADLVLTPLQRGSSKDFTEEDRPIALGWPVALNDRPLTLRAWMIEVQTGLLAQADSNVPAARFGIPLAVAPQIRFGVFDWLTLSVSSPRGVCLSSRDCDRLSPTHIAGAATFLIEPGPFFSFAAFGQVASVSLRDFATNFDVGSIGVDHERTRTLLPVSAGFIGRIGGGERIALQATGALTHAFAQFPVTNATLAAKLVLEAHERLSFDVGAQVGLPFAEDFVTRDPASFLPVTLGVTWTPTQHLDVRAQLVFRDLQAHETAAGTDSRELGLVLAYRPRTR